MIGRPSSGARRRSRSARSSIAIATAANIETTTLARRFPRAFGVLSEEGARLADRGPVDAWLGIAFV
jgi:hypothetical protein